MTPQRLQDAIDTFLQEDGHLPTGWLVVFLHPAQPEPLDAAAARFAAMFAALRKSRTLLVGGEQAPFKPRPHILRRIVVRNAKEQRYDYFFFPSDDVVISGCWDLTFPVMFPDDTPIGWLQEAAEAAGLELLPPEG